MEKSPNTILLADLDDTLINTCETVYQRIVRLCQNNALSLIRRDDFVDFYKTETVQRFIDVFFPQMSQREYFEAYQNASSDTSFEPLISPGKLAVLKKQFDLLAVLTSSPEAEMTSKMACLPADTFAHTWHAGNLDHLKPDPRCFEEPLKAMNTERDRVTYIGDHIFDWQSARDAGIKFKAVLTGNHSRIEFEDAGVNPDDIVDSIDLLLGE